MTLPGFFKQGSFTVDPGTTPEMLREKRARLAALMPQYGKAKYVGEGVGQLLYGIGAGARTRKMDQYEKEQRAAASEVYSGALAPQSGPMSVLGVSQQGQQPAAQAPSADAEAIRAGLIARGLPDYVADGFVMNFQDESGLNPGINERNPTVAGSRGGFGLAQWTGPRRVALEEFAAQRGADVSDPNVQMDFLMTELQGPESRAAASIMGTADKGQAAAAIVNEFLRPAETHRAARVAEYTGGGGQDLTALRQAAANPWLTEAQRGTLNGMIESALGQQAAAEERYWKQQDPMYQAQLADLQKPDAPDPGTDDMQEYAVARSQGYTGTFQEYMIEMKKAGASNTTLSVGGEGYPGLGKLSTDYGYVMDPATGQPVIDPASGLPKSAPIPGSPAAQDAAKVATAGTVKAGNAATATEVVTTAASRARAAAQQRELGGLGSSLVGWMNPYSDSAEVQRQVAVLKANASAENLNAMRAASPTGAALGAASDRDLMLLADKSGALDPNSPTFERDLDDYELTLLRIIHGKDAGDAIYEQTRAEGADGWKVVNGVKMRVKQ